MIPQAIRAVRVNCNTAAKYEQQPYPGSTTFQYVTDKAITAYSNNRTAYHTPYWPCISYKARLSDVQHLLVTQGSRAK